MELFNRMGAMMDVLSYAYVIWDFLGSDAGKAILAALFMLSEALGMVPQVKANSVFQGVANMLKKLSGKATVALLILVMTAACSSYLHSKQCNQAVNGYQSCTHYIQYETEAACVGSCAKK